MKFVKLLIIMTFAISAACTSKPASAPAPTPAAVLTEKTEPAAAVKQAADKLANTKTYYYLLTNDVEQSKMEFYFERPNKMWMKGKGPDLNEEIYLIGTDNYMSHGDNEWFKNSPINDGVDFWNSDLAKTLSSGKCIDFKFDGKAVLEGRNTFTYYGKCEAQPEPFIRKLWLSEETGFLLKTEDTSQSNVNDPNAKKRTAVLDYEKKMEIKAPISE